MAQINVRVEDSVKRDAEQVFSEIGLSMNAAITVFLKACAREQGIPFQLSSVELKQNSVRGGGYPLPEANIGRKSRLTKKADL